MKFAGNKMAEIFRTYGQELERLKQKKIKKVKQNGKKYKSVGI